MAQKRREGEKINHRGHKEQRGERPDEELGMEKRLKAEGGRLKVLRLIVILIVIGGNGRIDHGSRFVQGLRQDTFHGWGINHRGHREHRGGGARGRQLGMRD